MKTSRSTQGFTLVEIMIVVVIIGLLAAMAIPAFKKVRESSIEKTCLNDGRLIGAACQQYYMDNGVSTVGVAFTAGTGICTSDISIYLTHISPKNTYSAATASVTTASNFTLSNGGLVGNTTGPGGGTAAGKRVFTSEGALYN